VRFNRSGFGLGDHLRFLLRPTRARGPRRSRRFIFLHEILRENTLYFAARRIGIFTKVPLIVLHRSDRYDLTDGKIEIVLVARRILEDRLDRKRRARHREAGPHTEEVC
jgi:hypothetical protein